jgi:CheY-like chemotaxis protein
MQPQEDFVQQVRDVLSHLYDYKYLEVHAFSRRLWPEARRMGANRAHQLSRLLLEGIEGLNPPGRRAEDSSLTRAYALLTRRYIEEQSIEQIIHELSYSRRQFFRDLNKAIEILAAQIERQFPADAAQPVPGQAANNLHVEVEPLLGQREFIDLLPVIESVCEVMGRLAEEYGVSLETRLDRRIPSIYTSRILLRQVFLTSLSNLIVQPGAAAIRLAIDIENERLAVKISATFEESHPLTPENKPGDLPDLSSVRRLVEDLGGSWQNSGAAAQGFTCSFDLPVHQSRVVLVIEDNEGVIQAFRRYLVGYDYQVASTTQGGQALQLAKELRPDVITLDVMMPQQDGWEVLQALKADPDTRSIPVIICSVLEDPALAQMFGAFAYLRKPVSQASLVAALNSLPRLRPAE